MTKKTNWPSVREEIENFLDNTNDFSLDYLEQKPIVTVGQPVEVDMFEDIQPFKHKRLKINRALKKVLQRVDRLTELLKEVKKLENARMLRLDDITSCLIDQILADSEQPPYGYCPECGEPGISMERRPDGDARCINGHKWKPYKKVNNDNF